MAEARAAGPEAEPGPAPEGDGGGGAAATSAGSAAARWLGEPPEPEAAESRPLAHTSCAPTATTSSSLTARSPR
eukprot:6328058-Alexandrium_andersonii.AAC.1